MKTRIRQITGKILFFTYQIASTLLFFQLCLFDELNEVINW